MITFDYGRGEGVEKGPKTDYVICERSLIGDELINLKHHFNENGYLLGFFIIYLKDRVVLGRLILSHD